MNLTGNELHLFEALLGYVTESGGDGDGWVVVKDNTYGERLRLAQLFQQWAITKGFKGSVAQDGCACFTRHPEDSIYFVKSIKDVHEFEGQPSGDFVVII